MSSGQGGAIAESIDGILEDERNGDVEQLRCTEQAQCKNNSLFDMRFVCRPHRAQHATQHLVIGNLW